MAYYVYSFLLPELPLLLAASQDWFRDLQPWVDFDFSQGAQLPKDTTRVQDPELSVLARVELQTSAGERGSLDLRTTVAATARTVRREPEEPRTKMSKARPSPTPYCLINVWTAWPMTP